MVKLTQANQNKIDTIVKAIPEGETITFGEIAEQMCGSKASGNMVGVYLKPLRDKEDYPWWRVTNEEKHPVADDRAFYRLHDEGWIIRDGELCKEPK